ncbi:MAG: hypothetical protein IJT91_05370 [Clostridia bacterium]|nr:hypothetical protein [Clostridia bacterium]
MTNYNMTRTGEELDEAMAIFMSGHESDLAAFELYIADLYDPSGFDISHGAVDSAIGAIVSG